MEFWGQNPCVINFDSFLLFNFILGDNKINFNAMAPLHIMHYNNSSIEEEDDWILFGIHLEEAKNLIGF